MTESNSSRMIADTSPTLGEIAGAFVDEREYVLVIPDRKTGKAQVYACLDEDGQELAFEALKGMAEAQLRRIRSGG